MTVIISKYLAIFSLSGVGPVDVDHGVVIAVHLPHQQRKIKAFQGCHDFYRNQSARKNGR